MDSNSAEWPYKNISRRDFEKRLAYVEKLLPEYGAEYYKDLAKNESCILNGNVFKDINFEKHIFKRGKEYISVGRIYFEQKPFIVLEFADEPEGIYEDADHFPYDLTDNEIKTEIEFALGINKADR